MSELLYVRSEKALSTNVGDDWVALNVEQGQCYGMEMVTGAVWALLAEPTGIAQICESLMRRYEVEPARCKIDVQTLIKQFQAEDLVEVVVPASM